MTRLDIIAACQAADAAVAAKPTLPKGKGKARAQTPPPRPSTSRVHHVEQQARLVQININEKYAQRDLMYEEIQELKRKHLELLWESRGNFTVPSRSVNEGGSQRIPT